MTPANDRALVPADNALTVGAAFDAAAAGGVFADYRARRAANTLRRQRADLAVFVDYLAAAQFFTLGTENPEDERKRAAAYLQAHAHAWAEITYGLVAGFPRWMLQQGYAIGSVNIRLVTVKVYAELAFNAGVLPESRYLRIKSIKTYAHKEAPNVDGQRVTDGIATRRGHKKAKSTAITRAQRQQLKDQPNTQQGRRDALLMCILLDHGLRCGEIARLEVSAFDLTEGTMTFYRPKVQKEQTHKLTRDALAAVRAYFQFDAPVMGRLLLSTTKGGTLTANPMTERAITKRVNYLGSKVGIEQLSAHDLRHSWATQAARNKTDPFALQEAGGWASLAMPRRYIDDAAIANENVDLGE